MPDFDPDGVPMLRITDMEHEFIDTSGLVTISTELSSQYSRTIVREGDIVLSLVGTIGKAFEIGPKLVGVNLSRAIARIQLDSNTLPRYLCWIFQSRAFTHFIDLVCRGTAQRVLNLSDLNAFSFVFPTNVEQFAISAFLDHETARIDALIEEQKRLIDLLKEKRQAVISHAVTKGLDPTVPMKDSGVEWLGEVPAHWVVSRAKLVADIFVPQRNKPELNDSDGVAWVTMEDMNGGYISATNHKVTQLAAEEAGSKVLKKGAVIASCVGRFGIVAINSVDVVINQQLQAFVPRKIRAEYLRSIVSLSREYFELIGTSATLVYVNQQGFENLPVLLPSTSEQDSICVYVDEANARFDALLSQSLESIQLLQERRSALISAAVTGKIDVRGWQPAASAQAPALEQEAVYG
ncbi:restriction endonuclease subunit S [Pseudomonas sp. PDM25]|uniref:restriction endonuclease subunit S n=1 Tax=Pseudomonas sp. PDM25 TaxID=2854772 RepID=UPI001C47401B|nr:restriction endonuclease subunit S [Pseudomonas sp. PDM25]MBV7515598.1 restriction endonuclease subunit S [Pseudomonas sp. PDM25]